MCEEESKVCYSNVTMFLKTGIFDSDMYLYQLNVECSLTAIVFGFSVLEDS